MKRRTIAIILIITCFFHYAPISFAHDDERKHYEDMESVIFGNQLASIKRDSEKKKKMQKLEYATSLAIDQFNGFKGYLLLALQQYNVPNIPNRITDRIDEGGINFFASGQTHRQYTHMGWTYVYDVEHQKANWPLRKQIMVETVKKVLNSNDDTTCDSFAAILYYIHILGDLQSDSKRIERYQVIPLIEKHGMSDLLRYKANRDIFTELYHYLPILFENRINKTYKSRYTSMMREIKNLYSRAKQDMKNNSEEDKKEYQNNLTPDQLDYYTKELLDILKHHMPSLLEHTIFEGVFY